MKNGQHVFQYPCSSSVISNNKIEDETQSSLYSAISKKSAEWKPGQKGNITITFGEFQCNGCSKDAAWSLVGNESNSGNPSMNLGYLDPPFGSFTFNGIKYDVPPDAVRNYCSTPANSVKDCTPGYTPGATVIHEFGHALGMMHEHQNNLYNKSPITLNKPQVNAYYNCLGMGNSGAATNVINTYTCDKKSCNYAGTDYQSEAAFPKDGQTTFDLPLTIYD